jgi:hypothetical protein
MAALNLFNRSLNYIYSVTQKQFAYLTAGGGGGASPIE